MTVTATEAKIQRQYKRGYDDCIHARAYGHSDEAMAYAEGVDRRQAKDAYWRGWENGRDVKRLCAM